MKKLESMTNTQLLDLYTELAVSVAMDQLAKTTLTSKRQTMRKIRLVLSERG